MSNRPNNAKPRNRTPVAVEPRSKTPWWIAAVVAIVVVVGIVVASSGGDSGNSAVTESGTIPTGQTVVPSSDSGFGSIQVTGAPLPPLEDPSNDPAVGMTGPTVSGLGLDGSRVTVPVEGTPTYAVFLAHWCPHCQAEVPRYVDWWAEEGLPEGIEFVAVTTGTTEGRPNFPPGAWLHDEGWPVPTLLDDANSSAGTAYGVSGFPFSVLLDADGRVVARTSGEIGPDGVKELLALVEPDAETGGALPEGVSSDATLVED